MRERIRATFERFQKPADSFNAARATERVVDRVQFKELKNIFTEHARRSGAVSNLRGFVGRDRISMQRIHGALGRYVPHDRPGRSRIMLNPHAIAREKEDWLGGGAELSFPERVMSVLFHEETHGVGFQKYETHQHLWSESAQEQMGFEKTTAIHYLPPLQFLSKKDTTFSLFNEGMIQLIAHEVFDEYVRQCGIESLTGEQISDPQYDYSAYALPRALAKALSDSIAHVCEVPEDVAWKGFVRSYYEGVDLEEAEMVNLFAEFFPATMLEDLRHGNMGGEDSSIWRSVSEILLARERAMIENTPKRSVDEWRRILEE